MSTDNQQAEVYVDYEGYRIRPPFRCMCCGREVSVEQWCFGRACGACDVGACQRDNRAYHPSADHERPSWWRDWDHTRVEKMAAYAEAVGAEPIPGDTSMTDRQVAEPKCTCTSRPIASPDCPLHGYNAVGHNATIPMIQSRRRR